MKDKTDSKGKIAKGNNRVETTLDQGKGIKSATNNKRERIEFQSSMEQSDF